MDPLIRNIIPQRRVCFDEIIEPLETSSFEPAGVSGAALGGYPVQRFQSENQYVLGRCCSAALFKCIHSASMPSRFVGEHLLFPLRLVCLAPPNAGGLRARCLRNQFCSFAIIYSQSYINRQHGSDGRWRSSL